ncbi:DEAD/DEAH box helicase domain protein [Hyphomicrobium denitrificans ATCC 51888]|uniref:DEAD/DEAH box helicase domain protein n=1 Tax=Hyphomicrobium denitrificans (strain ATCC 51888 / DSM 1869 / NCIMB 11706 / TK 0415) TaxID=582899 RepID=D8JRE8_HYPDA|nr:DEAD/DEAH box helicase [Hyphomicrobium denitrificans]ADJ22177.1 DEAD/DEAH box helicase domain protein [Hyphomicrobium denitrificans ATCC 51888]
MTFPSVHPALGRALSARGYSAPTAVQLAVLEANTVGRDLLVSAQTGSGKTVAFGLAMASTLLGEAERLSQAAEPLALIIAPTRELAMQVQRELDWLYADTGARVVTCVGGMDARAEARQLGFGAHIVVGTPGRLRDHLERRRLDLTKLAAVVLDEADEMLDLGFREDLEFILDATPEGRQTLLFSATMPREIEALARRYQRDAVRIETVKRNEQHADIDYRAIRIAPADTENAIVNVLRFHEADAALVFCSTREAVKRTHARLLERGFAAVALSGELTQNERTHALQALRDSRARVLVATDVAARGLDLPALALVIHADLPNNAETLLHRSGRTGRAGNKGLSVLIVPFNRRRKADALLAAAKLKVTWGSAPTSEEIRARDQERFLASSIFTDPATNDDLNLSQSLQANRSADEIALALVRMHRAQLPAPEDLSDDPGPPQRRDDRARAPRERDERAGLRPKDHRSTRPVRDHGREMVWFRIDIGRERNAEPRWLLPLLCRAGNVTKAEIGSIKIFDRDTRFQIAAEFADTFADAARAMKPNEGRISRIGASMGDDAGTPGNPTFAARQQNDDEGKAATLSDPQTGRHAKTPWRDRNKEKSGAHFHRKRDAQKTHAKGAGPHPGPSKSNGEYKPVSKYAHKKKHQKKHRPAP